jgi:CDP-glucose 4,6-dehydratase
MENLVVDPKFWSGKKVFLTGHTGFKGSWMMMWLTQMGAEVTGYALAPDTQPSLYQSLKSEMKHRSVIANINDMKSLSTALQECDPQIIFHMAAQPLVRLSYAEPLETFQTNIIGTANVLQAARPLKNLKAVVVITTDKVYENSETGAPFQETDILGGHDPYSSSKACTEIVTTSMRRSFFHSVDSAAVATVRAGNVIGGGDWAVDRIVPDVIKAFQKNVPVHLRNPNAIRPWQHVLEPLGGYLTLAQKLCSQNGRSFASAWNFGPESANAVSVGELVKIFGEQWPGGQFAHDDGDHPHEASFLKLDSSKAKRSLGWSSVLDMGKTASMTVQWYRQYLNKEKSAFDLCNLQIAEYCKELNHVARK